MMTNDVATLYASEGYKSVHGFGVNGRNLLAINLLSDCQVASGVHGDLMEIGIFHGRTAILLGLVCESGEKFIGVDAFGISDGIQHEDRQVDLDYYGDGNVIKTSFYANWSRLVSDNGHGVEPVVIEKDSRDVTAAELLEKTGGVRFFSLDGGHSEKSTFHDLELAEAVMVDGGILVVDDYFLEDCPAVSVGTMRYFFTRESKMVPFLIFCGRVFFTTANYVERYREALFDSDIGRWVRFGEFLGNPVVCLIDRHVRDADGFAADVAEWKRCSVAYLAGSTAPVA